jgi:hypothetical protein
MKKILVTVGIVSMIASLGIASELQLAARPKAASQQSVTTPAGTNDGGGSLGLGFQGSAVSGTIGSAAAARYWFPDGKFGVEGALGFMFNNSSDRPRDKSAISMTGKFLGALRREHNITVYWFGLFGLEYLSHVNPDDTTNTDTKPDLLGGLGAEFFLPGIPNLGFSTEVGVGYAGRAETFGTFGSWIPTAGVKYYF